MLLQNLIWIGIFILFLGLCSVVKFWPDGGISRTFSQHVAKRTSSIVYYIFLFAITLPIFAIYFFLWFIPTFQPPLVFAVFIATALMAQMLCTFVPEIGKRRARIHQAFALLSALGLLFALGSLLFIENLSLLLKLAVVLASTAMTWLLILLISSQAKHPKVLYIQVGYFALFFATILTIVYL